MHLTTNMCSSSSNYIYVCCKILLEICLEVAGNLWELQQGAVVARVCPVEVRAVAGVVLSGGR